MSRLRVMVNNLMVPAKKPPPPIGCRVNHKKVLKTFEIRPYGPLYDVSDIALYRYQCYIDQSVNDITLRNQRERLGVKHSIYCL